ncbi:MAG: hypothetical protein AAF430_10055 [Myxococcota bacterium]
MLLCKACNTRFQEGKSACPSCGRRAFATIPDSGRPEPERLPVAEARSLGRAKAPVEEDEQGDGAVDLELAEVDVLAEAVDPAAAEELKPERPARPRRTRSLEREPGPAVLHLSAAQVRTLVGEQPDLVEPNLKLYSDPRNNQLGVDYRTPVGSIDILARDADGDFVVVAVPDPRDVDTLMPEIFARIGYVKKHLAKDRSNVRGVIVIEEIPEELAYAAAGAAQTISFKAYRVALTFHDLPL